MKCEASWPADSTFWKFDKCKEEATRICLENERRVALCETHGKHKKLVAMIEVNHQEGR